MRCRLAMTAAAAALAAGCGGSSGAAGAAAPARSATVSPTTVACPAPPASAASWPAPIPASLPRLPGTTVSSTSTHGQLHTVSFRAPLPLRAGVLDVVKRLPAAGYQLGRGDAEAAEADAPFGGHGVRGLLRLRAAGPCSLTGILAVSTGASAPSESGLPGG